MKVFVPMSDAALGVNGELCQSLVPFDPSYLVVSESISEGRKPSNWVSDCDYERARERLYATEA
ncbi:MAG: hypothetical protein ISP91_06000 [Pseudomonadales bacterium]|jgi:hypothetical protein|nr:hypothetical protein [Pseudomonadales bacterium]